MAGVGNLCVVRGPGALSRKVAFKIAVFERGRRVATYGTKSAL